MKRTLILIALMLAAWQAADGRTRCDCFEFDTPVCAAYWRADAVFTGLVTDIKKLPDDSPDSVPMLSVRLIVDNAYRGIKTHELDVETLSGSSCDMTIKKGERWLIYAYLDKATGRLEISPCTRTHLLEGADEDLDYIRGLARREPEQSVLGRLAINKYQPIPDAKVTVGGGGQMFETATDSDGNFAVALPLGGAYTVRVTVPFSASSTSYTAQVKDDATDEKTVVEYPVEIPAGHCAYDEINVYKIDLHATAEIGGKVLDSSGQPVTRGRVHLYHVAPKDGDNPYADNTEIKEDGSFKFEYVAVGNYYLIINPQDEAPSESDAPYPKTFYPGVADESKATPLIITEGLKLGDLILRVRPAMRERVLMGTVVWPNGKPVSEARVSLYDSAKDRLVLSVGVSDKGRFRMSVYGDFKYVIMAQADGDKEAESEKVKVPGADKPAPFRLVVKPD
jgi:hypothetical protein